LGESTERYIWGWSDYFLLGKLRSATYSEIKERALDIFSLAGFSLEQRKAREVLQFDEKTIFGWILAKSLVSQKAVFCPAQLLSYYYVRNYVKRPQHPNKKEPMLRWCISTGMAAGQSVERALLGSVLEIIERDAFMITYLNKISPPEYDHESLSEDEEVAGILAIFKRYGLSVHLFHLPSDFSAYTTLAMIIDHSGIGPAVSVSASADFDFRSSILDALSECLSCRTSLRKRRDKDEPVGRINREGRLIYWSKPENLSKLDFLFGGKKEEVDWNEHKNFFESYGEEKTKKECEKRLDILRKEFTEKRYDLLWINMTSPEIRKAGLEIVSAVSPDLQPLHLDEEIPYWSGKRLAEIPEKLGYAAAKNLNHDPHPFP
jgi:ribosomal protein S12 methylthiotransferase accessory factor